MIEIRSNPNKFKKISEEEINDLLNEINIIRDEITQLGEPKFNEFNEENVNLGINETQSLMKYIFGELVAEKMNKTFEEFKKNPKKILQSSKILFNYISYLVIPYIECFYLAILTTPHADIRYPSQAVS